jgi:hypothetical protein
MQNYPIIILLFRLVFVGWGGKMGGTVIVWTDYMKYRLSLRGYDLSTVEHILRYSSERYVDTVTGRGVTIGRHKELLVMIPYERAGDTLTPVTIHVTSRQQINSRLKSGRLKND